MSFHKKNLVRESEWARIYNISDPGGYLFESKFLVDGLHVSLPSIRDRWPLLSAEEKIEFATAFSAQPPRDGDDQQILQFLMQVGPEEVWKSIAIVSTFHPNTDYALQFLLERVRGAAEGRANYYQALELLRRAEAIPRLRERFDEYQGLVSASDGRSERASFWVDYLQCCKTLFTLTKGPAFLAALEEGRVRAPLELQPYAATILYEVEKG